MIRFFRSLRQQFISKNQMGKYFKYAIGEILLVMVGILLALQVNNWNENRKEADRRQDFLVELRKGIASDIVYLEKQDSVLSSHFDASEKALAKFYEARTLDEVLHVDSIFRFQWGDLPLNTRVYDEMLNTGSLYLLKSEALKKQITDYYNTIDSRQYMIKKINDVSIDFRDSKIRSQLDLLVQSGSYKDAIDTSWIGDPNTSEFLELHDFYHFTQQNVNMASRQFRNGILEGSRKLVQEIDKVLESK